MVQTIIIRCDGPECARQLDLKVDKNTWMKLVTESVTEIKEEDGKTYPVLRPKMHRDFCSYYCLDKFIHIDVMLS